MSKRFAPMYAWLFPNGDVLAGMTLIFMASAFVLHPAAVWTMTFYFGFLPATLYQLYRGDRPDWKNPLFIITCLLMLWTALTLLWGENPGKGRVPKFALGSLFTTLYIVGLSMALRKNALLERRIGSVFIFMGAANAALSVIYYLLPFSSAPRLGGWAETRHPILGALVIGVCCLFSFDRFLRERAYKKLYGAVVVLCLLFIALTQSRGVYISITASMIVLLGAASWRQRRLVFTGGVVGLLGLVMAAYVFYGLSLPDLVHKVMERGASHRPEIWAFTLKRVAEHPWFGHGPAAYLGLADFPFPHDIFLSTLFYYGMIGLVLFLIVLARSIGWLARQWEKDSKAPLLAALLVNALCGGLTDLAQLASGPEPIWLILWLPVSLIFAHMSSGDAHKLKDGGDAASP